MARNLASLETELGILESELDDAAGKVFDKMDAVRARAPDVFKRTHARVDGHAQTVDRVDKLLTSLDRANERPTSAGSLNGSGNSSKAATPPPPPPVADSAEKKTQVTP